ncbi:MAG: DNA polymerase III subunit delta' [Chloroflexota bacterium]|nr:DNA polymerase III subunit delta' [Chloroflexota bacterium]MDE2883914.1 DNA polymerase III subunit delta' [Chloroflexota bacterium]
MLSLHGQQLPVRTLERSLSEGRLHHAYLFIGPAHLGKTTLAVQFAQALNCDADAPPCGACSGCTRIAEGNHADVRLISLGEEAGSIGIGAVREIINSAHLRPYEGRTRVFIIAEADLLTRDAANALLKVLEEPPDDVVLILVGNSLDNLLPTVRSRCQTLHFHPLSVSEVAHILQEERGVSPQHAEVLARLSRGCIGWALAATGDDTMYASVHQRIEQIVDAIDGGLEERFAYAGELARRLDRDRGAGREELLLWLRWLRDIMLVQQGNAAGITNLSWREVLEGQAAALQPADVVRWTHNVNRTIEALERNANVRLALDVFMLEAPLLKAGA